MLKSKLRLLGMSALVGAGLVASGPVNAANFTIGSVDVTNRHYIICGCFS